MGSEEEYTDLPLWKQHYIATFRKDSEAIRKVTCWNDRMESITFPRRSANDACSSVEYPYATYNEAVAAHNDRMLGDVYAHDTLPVRNKRMFEQTDLLRDKRNVAVERIRLSEHTHSVFEKGLTVLGLIYYVLIVLVLIRLGYMLHESGGGILDEKPDAIGRPSGDLPLLPCVAVRRAARHLRLVRVVDARRARGQQDARAAARDISRQHARRRRSRPERLSGGAADRRARHQSRIIET